MKKTTLLFLLAILVSVNIEGIEIIDSEKFSEYSDVSVELEIGRGYSIESHYCIDIFEEKVVGIFFGNQQNIFFEDEEEDGDWILICLADISILLSPLECLGLGFIIITLFITIICQGKKKLDQKEQKTENHEETGKLRLVFLYFVLTFSLGVSGYFGHLIYQVYYKKNTLSLEKLYSYGFRTFSNMNLQKTDFSYVNLQGINLEKADLQNTKLYNTHMEKSKLTRANLEGSILSQVHLEKANLQGG